MKKTMKKVVGMMLAVAMMCGVLAVPTPAKAYDYSDKTVKWGSSYSSEFSDDNPYDLYKVVVPAKMTVNIRGIDIEGGIKFSIYDQDFTMVKDISYLYNGEVVGCDLSEGTYYFKILEYDSDRYTIAFYTAISTPNVTLSSTTPGTFTVRASKEDNSVGGYQIRYRLSKKSWKTKTVECIDELNTTIKGLSKGKIYSVQVRKYAESTKGKTYYSKWSDIKKIQLSKK